MNDRMEAIRRRNEYGNDEHGAADRAYLLAALEEAEDEAESFADQLSTTQQELASCDIFATRLATAIGWDAPGDTWLEKAAHGPVRLQAERDKAVELLRTWLADFDDYQGVFDAGAETRAFLAAIDSRAVEEAEA